MTLSWRRKRDLMTSEPPFILSFMTLSFCGFFCTFSFFEGEESHYFFVWLFVQKHYEVLNLNFQPTFFYNLSLRYFPLLAKQKPDHPECDILTNVFAVLSAKNLSEATSSLVMDIADSLLNSPDFEPTEQVSSLSVTDCVVMVTGDMTEGMSA